MIQMSQKDAITLKHRIVKQSVGVSVKQGRTNGRIVLHLIQSENPNSAPPREAESRTIKAASEWTYHPWNVENQPKQKKNHDAEEA